GRTGGIKVSRTEALTAWIAHSVRKTLLIRYAIILLALSPVAVIFQNCSKGFQANSLSLSSISSILMTPCTPASNLVCYENMGAGNRVCNSQGTGYGLCGLSSCDPGYTLKDGICTSNSCFPGSTALCSGPNGNGIMTCNP